MNPIAIFFLAQAGCCATLILTLLIAHAWRRRGWPAPLGVALVAALPVTFAALTYLWDPRWWLALVILGACSLGALVAGVILSAGRRSAGPPPDSKTECECSARGGSGRTAD